MDRRTFFLGVAGVALLATSESLPVAFAQGASSKAPKIKPWGFDLAGMDKSVAPGADFALYNGGQWQRTAKIPADRTRWGAFDELREQADLDVKVLVEATVKAGGKPGTDEQRIADFYTSYVDVAAIEAKGLSPIQPLLTEIANAPDVATLAVIAARPGSPVIAPLGWGVGPDQKDPD